MLTNLLAAAESRVRHNMKVKEMSRKREKEKLCVVGGVFATRRFNLEFSSECSDFEQIRQPRHRAVEVNSFFTDFEVLHYANWK